MNTVITATYWQIGRHIVESEQGGDVRAGYGKALILRLSEDLAARFGRGFSPDNLELMRRFYQAYGESRLLAARDAEPISATASRKSVRPESGISETVSRKSAGPPPFPLPWSHYVRLIRLADAESRRFYEAEALRGGWSIRQLDRQIGSRFHERTLLSRNKAAMLRKGGIPKPGDATTVEEEVKDPLVLEFLGLKDEYSESDLEEALVGKLEAFLLELGSDFAFVGRQKRLRIDDVWFRVDLLMYHRRLRCLVIIDLKTGEFSHADVGQMNVYLNYAREHWRLADENPPVGLILCASRKATFAKYALAGLENAMLSAEYRMALPGEDLLAAQLHDARRQLEARARDKAK